jgi:hypothetical protein
LGGSLVLDVVRWAAIVSAETAVQFGEAEEAGCIPAGQRRRLPAFTRDILRCALPLMRDAPGRPIILSSPHGDMISTATLLTDITKRDPLSPSLFGLSVHNAPIGALSLLLENPGDQTALAGDAATLSAGLTEAYGRLATAEAAEVLLIHADEKLPEMYAPFDATAPGVFVAMVLRLVGGSSNAECEIAHDREGAVALVASLSDGARRLRFTPPRLHARAA